VPDRTPLWAVVEGEADPPRQWLGFPVQPGLLRGRPTAGAAPARWRQWLAVELTAVAVFAALGARFGDSNLVVPLLLLGAALVAVSYVDVEHHRIPDRITFPTLALSLPLILAVSLDHDRPKTMQGALVGAVAYFAILFAAHLVSPRGMGFGDVKLALLMGVYLGWLGWDGSASGSIQYVLYGLMLGCVLGIVIGVGQIVVTRQRGEMPFGPALALACLVVLLWLP